MASRPSPDVVAALQQAHRRGARVVSICVGAFALAAAGLLDGRRATTHWRHDDGDVLTSAGCAAGIDLGLHLVRKDFGAAIANAVARRLVSSPHRDGGQAQCVEAPVVDATGDDPVGRSMAWAQENLAEPLTVERLASKAHMSTRTYLRHFARRTGTSPIKWLIARRVHASLPLLESTEAPVDEIAAAVGFETATTFRHHFGRIMHTSPSAYRRAFRASPRPAGIG